MPDLNRTETQSRNRCFLPIQTLIKADPAPDRVAVGRPT